MLNFWSFEVILFYALYDFFHIHHPSIIKTPNTGQSHFRGLSFIEITPVSPTCTKPAQ